MALGKWIDVGHHQLRNIVFHPTLWASTVSTAIGGGVPSLLVLWTPLFLNHARCGAEFVHRVRSFGVTLQWIEGGEGPVFQGRTTTRHSWRPSLQVVKNAQTNHPWWQPSFIACPPGSSSIVVSINKSYQYSVLWTASDVFYFQPSHLLLCWYPVLWDLFEFTSTKSVFVLLCPPWIFFTFTLVGDKRMKKEGRCQLQWRVAKNALLSSVPVTPEKKLAPQRKLPFHQNSLIQAVQASLVRVNTLEACARKVFVRQNSWVQRENQHQKHTHRQGSQHQPVMHPTPQDERVLSAMELSGIELQNGKLNQSETGFDYEKLGGFGWHRTVCYDFSTHAAWRYRLYDLSLHFAWFCVGLQMEKRGSHWLEPPPNSLANKKSSAEPNCKPEG